MADNTKKNTGSQGGDNNRQNQNQDGQSNQRRPGSLDTDYREDQKTERPQAVSTASEMEDEDEGLGREEGSNPQRDADQKTRSEMKV